MSSGRRSSSSACFTLAPGCRASAHGTRGPHAVQSSPSTGLHFCRLHLLCRVEGERVQLQEQNDSLRKQVHHHQQHASELAAQLHAMCAARDGALAAAQHAQRSQGAEHAARQWAVQEYRSSEIVAVGLRDVIRRLQQQLGEVQGSAGHQVGPHGVGPPAPPHGIHPSQETCSPRPQPSVDRTSDRSYLHCAPHAG